MTGSRYLHCVRSEIKILFNEINRYFGINKDEASYLKRFPDKPIREELDIGGRREIGSIED